MSDIGIAATMPSWGVNEKAANMAEFVLSCIGDDVTATRWSAGLAMVCFAPPMPDRLCREVHRRLSLILAT
jgi:hypothetical protein